MGTLLLVTWFCSEFLISSSHFPFPSSLPSQAAACFYAAELMRVLVFMCQFHSGPFPMWRLFTICKYSLVDFVQIQVAIAVSFELSSPFHCELLV